MDLISVNPIYPLHFTHSSLFNNKEFIGHSRSFILDYYSPFLHVLPCLQAELLI